MNTMKRWFYALMAVALVSALLLMMRNSPASAEAPAPESGDTALGKLMFFDENLSANGTQSCAACHGPEVGFTGPDSLVNAGGAV